MKHDRDSKENLENFDLVLKNSSFSSPQRRWIIKELQSRIRTGVIAREDSYRWIRDLCERSAEGEPLQYLLQRWEFRHLELFLDHRVLIPRPETELIVDIVLDILRQTETASCAFEKEKIVVDLGVGSGAIALSIASEFDLVKVLGTEVSPEALEVAVMNLQKVSLDRGINLVDKVDLKLGSYFDPLPSSLCGRLDVVVSNPPYLSEELYRCAPTTVRNYEPKIALTPGPTGLEAICVIVSESRKWLVPGGALVVEISPEQSQRVQRLLEENGFMKIKVVNDLTGRQRFVVGVKQLVQ